MTGTQERIPVGGRLAGASGRALLCGALAACLMGLGPVRGYAGAPRESGGVRLPGQRPEAAAAAAGRPATAPAAPPSPAPSRAAAQPPRIDVVRSGEGTTLIGMDVYGLEIDHLLKTLSEAAGVTIVKSEQVTGPVTIIAPDPVPVDVAFQILNSVLEVRGFTMVRAPTGIYKVLPIRDAMQSSLPMRFGQRPEDVPLSDELITQVISLTHLEAQTVAGEIRPLLSANAIITPTATNSLVISDLAANVHRALAFIADAEAQLSTGLQIFPLRYRDAQEMASLVGAIVFGGAAGQRGPVAAWERRVQAATTPQAARPAQAAAAQRGVTPEFCYPDARTNSLIVRATPVHLRQVGELVDQLDRPISLRDAYFVYPVQNLIASDLARLVAPLVGASVTAATGAGQAARLASGGQTTTASRAATTAARTTTTARPVAARAQERSPELRLPDRDTGRLSLELEPLAGERERPEAGFLAAQAAEAAPAMPAPEVVPIQTEVFAPPDMQIPDMLTMPAEFEPAAITEVPGAVGARATIAADDNTNTLLISAPSEQLELIQRLLEELDVLPPQVYIQAVIAEVALKRDNSFGFQWPGLPTLGSYEGAPVGRPSIDLGLVTRAADGTVTRPLGLFGEITAGDFAGIMTALSQDSHARILSAPTIFTANNQPASIRVVTRQPFPTGTLTTTTGTGEGVAGVISTSVRYEPVGIQLLVTPRVTQGDIVQMNVLVTADDVSDVVRVGAQDFPTTQNRQTEASLSVKAGNTVVLGGLMRETLRRSATRVPLLGDLPLLGAFFRSTTSVREKSELLVFLTPRVMRTAADAARYTDERKARAIEIPRLLQGPSSGPAPAEEAGRR